MESSGPTSGGQQLDHSKSPSDQRCDAHEDGDDRSDHSSEFGAAAVAIGGTPAALDVTVVARVVVPVTIVDRN